MIQQLKSILPKREELLVETFPEGERFYMLAYPFEGRLAHQTLGMLLTRRLERATRGDACPAAVKWAITRMEGKTLSSLSPWGGRTRASALLFAFQVVLISLRELIATNSDDLAIGGAQTDGVSGFAVYGASNRATLGVGPGP